MSQRIVKLTDAQIALIGATGPEDFGAKLESFCATKTQLETAMANQPDFATFESRLKTLEGATPLTEAKVKEIVTASTPDAVKAFVASEDGQKAVHASASKAVIGAAAATGTLPVKDTPAPAAGATGAADLVKAGDYAGAWAISPELKAEFPDAKCYEAYAKAEAAGRVNIAKVPPKK